MHTRPPLPPPNEETANPDDAQLLQATMQLVCTDFELNQQESVVQHQQQGYNATWEVLCHWLGGQIAWMLQHKPGVFFQALYRLDVQEKWVRQAFRRFSGQALHLSLAEIILQREMKKVHTRKLYKNERKRNNSTSSNYPDDETW